VSAFRRDFATSGTPVLSATATKRRTDSERFGRSSCWRRQSSTALTACRRAFYKDGAIATSRSKTGEPVYWPAPAPLRAILKDHDAITLCANSSGEPWIVCGFRASWRKIRLKLEAERRVNSGLTLYGLRHTVAMILRECSYDERTIADALGQKTVENGATLCTRRRPHQGNVWRRRDAGPREMNRRRTKVSNLSWNVSNRTASADGRSSKHQPNSWDSGGRHKDLNLGPAD
jgi:hypothetical protein